MTSTEVESILERRRSVRAFLDTPVERTDLELICRAARQAPSGGNLQPGQFRLLAGNDLASLVEAIQKAVDDGVPPDEEYTYFPRIMSAELKRRQRTAGYALYEALGISRRDTNGRRRQFNRNYSFFGAPVGMIVSIDRTMGSGCFMDLGMTLMAFMLAANDRGLGTTGIGALARYARTIHEHLEMPRGEMVVCGIAIGFPDDSAPANNFRTDRIDLSDFVSFKGFP